MTPASPRTRRALACLLLATLAALAIAPPAAAEGPEDEPCQDPRAMGIFCHVCWEVLDGIELAPVGPYDNPPRWKCARTEAPAEAHAQSPAGTADGILALT